MSIRISPSLGSYNLISNLISEVFPEPLSPTKATSSPGAIVKLRSYKILTLGWLGKLKFTFLNSILPLKSSIENSFPF